MLPSVTVASLTETVGGLNGQDRSLIRTEVLLVFALAVAASSQPSPLQSATATAEAPGPAAKVFAVIKVPSPSPRRIMIVPLVLSPPFTAMSSVPARLKSPRTTELGQKRGVPAM